VVGLNNYARNATIEIKYEFLALCPNTERLNSLAPGRGLNIVVDKGVWDMLKYMQVSTSVVSLASEEIGAFVHNLAAQYKLICTAGLGTWVTRWDPESLKAVLRTSTVEYNAWVEKINVGWACEDLNSQLERDLLALARAAKIIAPAALYDPLNIFIALRWFAVEGLQYYRTNANKSPLKTDLVFASPTSGAYTTITVDQNGKVLGEVLHNMLKIELQLSDHSQNPDGLDRILTRKRMATISIKDFSRIASISSTTLKNIQILVCFLGKLFKRGHMDAQDPDDPHSFNFESKLNEIQMIAIDAVYTLRGTSLLGGGYCAQTGLMDAHSKQVFLHKFMDGDLTGPHLYVGPDDRFIRPELFS
jgi:hypothetical protein